MTPPHTRREAVVDTLHGVPVPDPYRWLEDGDDPEVQQWVSEQNGHTRTALDALPESRRAAFPAMLATFVEAYGAAAAAALHEHSPARTEAGR